MTDQVLGKDFVLLQGRGGRDSTNGATVKGDDFMHLSVDTGRTTVCRQAVENFLLTYADVKINCPGCIEDLRSRRS